MVLEHNRSFIAGIKIMFFRPNSIKLIIRKAFKIKKERNWDKIYFAVDLHDTIVKSSYKNQKENIVVFPYAIEALKKLSDNKEICLILFTSSHKKYLFQYFSFFEDHNINFQYLNENPECPSTLLGDFSQKFYYNVLLDDKAGFNPYFDWKTILRMKEI
jgi:hypothetical protein